MHAFGAAYHGAFLPPVMPAHNRSVSLGPPNENTARGPLSKAKSTNSLRQVASANPEYLDTSFHTLQDPRSNGSKNTSRRGSSASRHPELNDEVAALSDKLISAINHQQTLDDSLSQARHELEVARVKIAELEAKERAQQEKLANGDLVTREHVAKVRQTVEQELEEEKKQRQQAQQEKRGIEVELETLTASLFEEANNLVAAANKDKDAVEKKNQQLRDQIKDEEAVIASQTEQLAELKNLMQQIQSEQLHDNVDSPRPSLGPASPSIDKEDATTVMRLLEAMNLAPVSPDLKIQPSPSTKLIHLLRAQCRTDIPAFDDFRNLLQQTSFRSHNPSHAPSRAGSGSYGGLNVIGLGSMYSSTNGSNPSLSQPASSKLAQSPALPGSFSPRPGSAEMTPLKETRFFKRVLQEDIEPTLRLDLAPTISWLSRRTILSAIGDNLLSVEPIPEPTLKIQGRFTPCSLCGENRKEEQNPRTHAMRVREGEGATKWPICTLCLEKVRAVGDLVGYVRMVRDGVVKVGDQKDEEEVWEELVRLRERLFWARMAGGVVPAFLLSNKNSPVTEFSAEGRAAAAAAATAGSEGNTSPAVGTPGTSSPLRNSRKSSEITAEEEEDEASRQARLQLQANLEHVTTFQNAAEHHKRNISMHSVGEASSKSVSGTPPATPPPATQRKGRESGVFPRISIPKMPQGFWDGQVNTLH